MATSVNNLPSAVFSRAVSENCNWAAVAAACGLACSAEECERAFFTLFVPNSAHVPIMSVTSIVEPEATVSIKQEEAQVVVVEAQSSNHIVASKPAKVSQPKPAQTFTMVDANKKRVRRKATQIKRLFQCVVEDCCRSYGTEGALKMHLKLKHPDVTYDPMNPPVIVDYVMKTSENGGVVTTKRRQRLDEEEESASGSIDDLNNSPPQSPIATTVSSIPQSPSAPSFDPAMLKAATQPRPPAVAALPQLSSMMHPSAVFTSQPMFNPAYPPMMPHMYAPAPAPFMPWAMPPAQNFLTTVKRTAPEVDVNMISHAKRAKTVSDETDILSTLVSLKGQH